MAGNVEFHDFSAQVIRELDDRAAKFLEEASFELLSETQRNTPVKTGQLKGSWEKRVDTAKKEATVGSPLEQAIWNEYGTGSHAENGNGRKGWWVYVEGSGKSSKVSKTYGSREEAEKTVAILRAKGFPAFASEGKRKRRTLRNAFDSKKNAIIRRADQIFGEE